MKTGGMLPTLNSIHALNAKAQECEANLTAEFERSQKLKQEILEYRLAILSYVQKSGWRKMINTITERSSEQSEEMVRDLVEDFFEL